MSRPDEGLIHTWLDGECSPEEAARIEQLVATDPAWAAAVAEARGLIAASSRIVGALDAVPRAMPGGSRAAPRQSARPAFHVRPWMGMAAGLALLVGTAYVLNDVPTPSVVPVAAVDAGAVRASPEATSPALEVPKVGPVPAPATTPAVRGEAAAGAPLAPLAQGASATAPSGGPVAAAPPPPAAPPQPEFKVGAAPTDARTVPAASPVARAEELGSVARERTRVAQPRRLSIEPSRAAAVTSMQDAAEPAARKLDGCWRVSAPPELVGVLRDPVIVRQAGDTLVLRTARGDVPTTRNQDRLSGGLVAILEACTTTP